MGQTFPHAPQFCSSKSERSQPLVRSPSQSPKPNEQVPPHVPEEQVGVVPVSEGQMFPHAPQLLGSMLVAVSHPLAALPSQSEKPALHVTLHAPFEH